MKDLLLSTELDAGGSLSIRLTGGGYVQWLSLAAQIFRCDAASTRILEVSALVEVWNGVARRPPRALSIEAFEGIDAPMMLSADGETLFARGRRIDRTPNGGMTIVGRDFGRLIDKFGDTDVNLDEFSRTLDRHGIDAPPRRPLDCSDSAEVELMDIVDRARELATMAHAGQVDKNGAPYIEHPARIAGRVSAARAGEDAEVVAWLHDVVEDTDVTLGEIERDFGRRIADAVDAITRRDCEGDAYYRRVAANPIARLVKEHDIADNTAPDRTAMLDAATRARLAAKYAHARELLAIAADPN